MKQVLDGEKVERTITVQGERVTRHHVTYNKATDANYELTWTFDFTNVSKEDLLTLASRAVLIGVRPEFKVEPAKDLAKWEDRVFMVSEYLAREREKLSPVEKAKRAFSAMTPEQIAEILANYQA